MFGVYRIVHRDSDNRYVGSTTRDFEVRWQQHRADLRNNHHHNPKLQNAWNKYGEDAFDFEIIEIMEDPDWVLPAEQFWIDREGYYNIAELAGAPMAGRRHTAEALDKISRASKSAHANEDSEARDRRYSGARQPKSQEHRDRIAEGARRRWNKWRQNQ